MPTETTRMTITLPDDLIAAVDRAVQEGAARSRNEFIAQALAHELRLREEAAIDAQFAAMADDTAYAALSKRLEDEFAADWEALRTRESQP
jgi:metal-responsive CopG/Arc/MetJ family transcriptional regulator